MGLLTKHYCCQLPTPSLPTAQPARSTSQHKVPTDTPPHVRTAAAEARCSHARCKQQLQTCAEKHIHMELQTSTVPSLHSSVPSIPRPMEPRYWGSNPLVGAPTWPQVRVQVLPLHSLLFKALHILSTSAGDMWRWCHSLTTMKSNTCLGTTG
jgi:hypothetical protein